MKQNYHFEGVVNIYLQGEEALEATGDYKDHINYFVVNPTSNIVIDDYRTNPAQKMREAMLNGDDGQFADTFSQPAWISITADESSAKIELHDPQGKTIKENLELWLGSIHGNTMPVRDTKWETIKAISDRCFAFASLVK
jgi:hypothetical protein